MSKLKPINPKIIYVSITGYGQNNSMAQIAGHDLNYIAASGVLSTIGTDKETISRFLAVQIADIAGGSYMSMNAILAALYQREKTGQGQQINLSMTNAAVAFGGDCSLRSSRLLVKRVYEGSFS
jgi:alpha-methylacyl-CoA racemase